MNEVSRAGSALRSIRPVLVGCAAAAMGIATGLTVAGYASAGTNQTYCGVLVAPRQPCGDSRTANRVYYNAADYSGGGSVSVCERSDNQYGLESRRCLANHADSANDLTPNMYKAFITSTVQVGNNSDNNHTIYGIYNSNS